jgi:maltose-binding protein MalE
MDLGGVGYSIMTSSRYPDVAAEYLKWWAVGNGAETLLKTGAFAASAELHVDAVSDNYPVLVDVIEAVSEGPTIAPYTQYLPDYAVARDGVDHYVQLLLRVGGIDINEFVDRCQSKLEDYF